MQQQHKPTPGDPNRHRNRIRRAKEPEHPTSTRHCESEPTQKTTNSSAKQADPSSIGRRNPTRHPPEPKSSSNVFIKNKGIAKKETTSEEEGVEGGGAHFRREEGVEIGVGAPGELVPDGPPQLLLVGAGQPLLRLSFERLLEHLLLLLPSSLLPLLLPSSSSSPTNLSGSRATTDSDASCGFEKALIFFLFAQELWRRERG